MHTLWEFIAFWWRCFLEGLNFGKTPLAVIKNVCGLIAVGIYLHGKLEPKWKELEKRIMVVAFGVYVVLIIFTTLFVAPFNQYDRVQKTLRDQETYEALEKSRPRLEPVLLIDKINTNLDEVSYHFLIVNSAGATAFNLQQHVRTTGRGHFHDWQDLSFKLNTIEPGGKISFNPRPWNWQANDIIWLVQLDLTYQCYIAGKVKNIRSSFEFQMFRNAIKEAEYYPNHFEVDFDPPEQKSSAAQFLSISDVKGDFVLFCKGPPPSISASNAVRQFYVDTNQNMIRFYFRSTNGHQVMLTNYYHAELNATNYIILDWDSQGALLAVNSVFEAEPLFYWSKILRDEGLNVETEDQIDFRTTFLGENDTKGVFSFFAKEPMLPYSASNRIRQVYIDPEQKTARFYFRTENGRHIMLTNYYEPATSGTNLMVFNWDTNGAMLYINANLVAEPRPYWEKIVEEHNQNFYWQKAQNDFATNFLAPNDENGMVGLTIQGLEHPLTASNAVRQAYIDPSEKMVRFYFRAADGNQVMLTNYYGPGINGTNWIQFRWDAQGAMLIIDSNFVSAPHSHWRKILHDAGIEIGQTATQTNFSNAFLAASDAKGAFNSSFVELTDPIFASNATRQVYFDLAQNRVRFYFLAADGHQVMLTNYYARGTNMINWVQFAWDPQGAMLLVNTNLVAQPRLFWIKMLEEKGFQMMPNSGGKTTN